MKKRTFYVTVEDLKRLTGKSISHCYRLMAAIRKFKNKAKRHLITWADVIEYFNVGKDEVDAFLSSI